MKKILMISPTPTHPQNAGNRARIFNVAQLLRKKGYDVHFLLTDFDAPDLESMKAYWKSRLHLFQPELHQSAKHKLSGKIHTVLKFFKRKLNRLYYRLHYSGDRFKYNYLIDDYYHPRLQKYLKKLQQLHRFDIVLIEYVYLSKAFEAFNGNVLKILDTHDILSDRYKIYTEKGLRPEWFSFFREEEAAGFNRADIIIAIQEEEKAAIRELTKKEIVLLGHTVNTPSAVSNNGFNNRLVIFASHNSINVNGINLFIEKIFPQVRNAVPTVKLILAGSVIQARERISHFPGVEFFGEVDDISDVYEMADIVINPARFGTGLKIKSIEALSFGKPLVAFSAGVAGLNHEVNDPFCMVCDTEDDFIQAIITLIRDGDLRNRLKVNALKFVESYNQQVTSGFFKSVEAKLGSAKKNIKAAQFE